MRLGSFAASREWSPIKLKESSQSVQRLRSSPVWWGTVAVLGGESTSLPLGEAATLATLDDERNALAVAYFARVVAKVKLGKVAAKVCLAHVVVGSDHTPLEDR